MIRGAAQRPRVLLVPSQATAGEFRSLDRVTEGTRRALASFADVMELEPNPAGDTVGFLAAFAAVRDQVDAVFDMTALAATGPSAPEVPVLIWALGNLPRGAGLLSIRRRFLKTIDTLLVNSSADRTILERTLPGGGLGVALVPFAIDTAVFRPAEPHERERGRKLFGLPADAAIAVFAGRVNVQKNLHSALLLLAATAAVAPTLHLAIAGAEDSTPLKMFGVKNQGYRLRLEGMAERLGIAHRVTFLGPLGDQELALLYRSSDLFVSLSLHHDENFGYAPIEAMASGLPALVSDWGGYRDSVRHGRTGFRVPTFMTGHGVRVAWRRAIPQLTALAGDPALRRRLGDAARVHAEREFSTEASARKLEQVVLAARKQRGTPGNPGSDAFRFHPTAARLQARNALRHLIHQKTGAPVTPRLDDEDYEIYRFFVGPYATADVTQDEAIAADRPDWLVEIRASDSGIESLDPIWPRVHRLDAPLRGALAAADGARTLAELAVLAQVDEPELAAAVTRLVHGGLLDLGRPYALSGSTALEPTAA